MPLAPTNIQMTTFSNQVVQSYTEGAYFRDDLCVKINQPNGGKTKRFPVFGTITVANVDDGADLSAGGSYTPTNVDISTFKPLLAYETVTYQTLSDYEGYIPASLSKRIGMDLALRDSNIKLNILAAGAYARASSAGKIEIVGTASTTPADADFATAFNTGLTGIRNAQVNPNNCYAIVRPEFFYALRRTTAFASRDFIGQGMTDNAKMQGSMFYGGVEILMAAGTFFGTNKASATDIPSAAAVNSANYWGVIASKDALGVYETQPVDAKIADIEHRRSWLVSGSTVWGAAMLQTAASFVFINEA